MSQEIEIVPVGTWALAQISEIEKSCFSHPWSMTALEQELACPDSYMLCALIGTDVAAYGSIRVALDEGSIGNIACLPQYRGRGAGGKILDGLVQIAKSRGTSSIFLEVRPSNTPAIRLYQSRGFAELGRRRRFYRDPAEDALTMVLALPTHG